MMKAPGCLEGWVVGDIEILMNTSLCYCESFKLALTLRHLGCNFLLSFLNPLLIFREREQLPLCIHFNTLLCLSQV